MCEMQGLLHWLCLSECVLEYAIIVCFCVFSQMYDRIMIHKCDPSWGIKIKLLHFLSQKAEKSCLIIIIIYLSDFKKSLALYRKNNDIIMMGCCLALLHFD